MPVVPGRRMCRMQIKSLKSNVFDVFISVTNT